jgi:hypothetical protein
MLRNGVIVFDDGGELLPDGRVISPEPTSWAKAHRTHENRAYVRRLLWKRDPAFAAALATAEQDFSCPTCPRKQQEMAVHRLRTTTKF